MSTNLSPRRPRSSTAVRRRFERRRLHRDRRRGHWSCGGRALSRGGREVIILESERHFGMHTSSRNSEVIHAGIHYEPNSLKARLCVAGRDLLYRYCAERGIPHRRCGKLTVATADSQLAALEKIESNARASGVLDLAWLDGGEVRRQEPSFGAFAPCHRPPPASSTRMS